VSSFQNWFAADGAPYYLAAVLGMVLLLAVSRRLLLLFFVLALPATLAHELTHLIFGWLSNGKPAGLSLRPRRKGRSLVLGSVTCHNVRWYNGLFIGLAPLALLPFAALMFRWRSQSVTTFDLSEVGWVYAVACFTLAALPSWQDLKVALAPSWLLLLLAALAVVLWTSGYLPLH
jgi:hypothetical protein